MMLKNQPIGIFDSGVGGISVLRTAHMLLPQEDFYYYGDTANAPYGTKAEAQVRIYAHKIVNFLLEQGIKALVIACNTATCAAAAELREQHPDLIIIGMEPALKLAHDQCADGEIWVLATPVSLSSRKYQHLYESYGKHAISIPCPELVEFVERGETDSPALIACLQEKFAPYLQNGHAPAAVVLGCTHYVFVKKAVQSVLPPTTRVLDGNEGTVRQLKRRLEAAELLNAPDAPLGTVQLFSSAGEQGLTLMKNLFTKPE